MALPPLELFSLEREGRLLPGGLFVCLNCEQGGHDDQHARPQRNPLLLTRHLPRLRVFPAYVHIVIPVQEKDFAAIEKSAAKKIIPDKVQHWPQTYVHEEPDQ